MGKKQRLDRALELARQARDQGRIDGAMYAEFVREVGDPADMAAPAAPANTPVLINLEVQGGNLPGAAALNNAVFEALNIAAGRVGGSVVRDSVRVVVGR